MADDLLSPRNAIETLPMGQQILKLQQEAEATRDKIKAMNKAMNAMVATAQAHQDAIVHFADTVAALGGIEHFGRAKDCLVDLASKRFASVKRQEEHISSYVKDFVEVRIATSLGMQAKVHEAIKEHEGASEKVHSLKKGSPKLVEAQANLTATQLQMDLLSFAFVNKLKQTMIDVSVILLDKLSLYFGEETALSTIVNAQATALIPDLAKHQVDLKKQRQTNDEERAIEMKRHQTSTSSKISVPITVNHQIKQGYLFCRASGKYRQRWVSILNARLMVYKDWKALEAEKTFDLVLCNVKPLPTDVGSHPYVFEIRNHMDDHMQFAATDDIEMAQWINVIQTNIAAQLEQNLPRSATGQSASDQYLIITSVKGNDKCADCRAPDPEWISLLQGITICIECCGVHRSFGSHISKVRSMKLDSLEPELILLMRSIGNLKSNSKVFEFSMPEGQRIPPNADRASREAFLKAKYVEKRWIPTIEDWPGHVTNLLRRKNPFKPTTVMVTMAQPYADLNWQRTGNMKTLLHKCVTTNNMVCALLLLKMECVVDPVDVNGMTPLHHAAQTNSASMARLLMQHGASTYALDHQQRTPRDVAIDNDAVDCIVLLDEDLNETMGAGSPKSQGNETDSILAASATSTVSHLHASGPAPSNNVTKSNRSNPSLSASMGTPASTTAAVKRAKTARPSAFSNLEHTISQPIARTPTSVLSPPQSARDPSVYDDSPIRLKASSLRKIGSQSPVDLQVHVTAQDERQFSTEEKRSSLKRTKSAKSVAGHTGLAKSSSAHNDTLAAALPPPLILPDPPSLPPSPAPTKTPGLPLPLPPPSSTSKTSSGPKSSRREK